MEVIQIYDTVKKAVLKVKVSPNIASRCKKDAAYTQALFTQIRGKKLGSNASLKIIPVKNTIKEENKSDEEETENWNEEETEQLIKNFQACKNSIHCPDSKVEFWVQVSQELENIGIHKTSDECQQKWTSLLDSYRQAVLQSKSDFPYVEEIGNALYSESRIQDTYDDDQRGYIRDSISFAQWTKEETFKLISTYKKHKQQFRSMLRKDIWKTLSALMAAEGFDKAPDKCENKWKNLKRSYKRSKNHTSSKFLFFNEMKSVMKDEEDDFDGSESLDLNDDRDDDEDKLDEENSKDHQRNDKDSDTNYEEIIIKNEDQVSWSQLEISTLLKIYGKYQYLTKDNLGNDYVWRKVSKEMIHKQYERSPEECKKMCTELFHQYSSSDTYEENFTFYKEIKKILSRNNTSTKDSKHTESCKCLQKKLNSKEKRHAEKMVLLKRKLDIEDRKVTAFEKYVKHLMEIDVHSSNES